MAVLHFLGARAVDLCTLTGACIWAIIAAIAIQIGWMHLDDWRSGGYADTSWLDPDLRGQHGKVRK